MEIVGYCEFCDRWFNGDMDHIDRFVCTACGRQPLRVVGPGHPAIGHSRADP